MVAWGSIGSPKVCDADGSDVGSLGWSGSISRALVAFYYSERSGRVPSPRLNEVHVLVP